VTITPSGTRVIPPLSPTLEINERFRALQAQGASIVHLGFGEAGLPVADILIEALTAGASDNAYGAVAGSSAQGGGSSLTWAARSTALPIAPYFPSAKLLEK
jgi:hypothetical protein